MKVKSLTALLLGLIVIFVLSAFMPLASRQQTEGPTGIDVVWIVFASLVGVPAFFVALVNLLKVIHIVPDGAANTVFYWLNILAFVGVAAAVFAGRLDIVSSIDAALAGVAKVIAEIVILLGGLTVSVAMGRRFWYPGVRGYPLIGHSNSLWKATTA